MFIPFEEVGGSFGDEDGKEDENEVSGLDDEVGRFEADIRGGGKGLAGVVVVVVATGGRQRR